MADALGTPGGVVSDEDHRLDQGGLIAPQTSTLDVRTGVLRASGTATLITGTAATGTMTVSIAPHHWVTSRGTADGVYVGTKETTTTVNIAAAPGANSRIDLVYVKQNDAGSSVAPDATTAELYGVVTGTAAVSPVKPAPPVGAIELGTVTVAAGATSTNGAGVTIANTARQTVARGARVPVRDQVERDALSTFPGIEVFRLDTEDVERIAGGAWIKPEETGYLADAGPGADATFTTSGTALTVNATVPTGLPTGRRIKVTGTVFVSTGVGVGATVAIAGKTRTLNQASLGTDVTVVSHVTDLTSGSRTFNLVVSATVGGQSITARSPQITVEIV